MPSKQKRLGWIYVRTNLAYGRKVRGHFGQKGPNFENFVRTKMGGFGKFWDQTYMGIIRGPGETESTDRVNDNRVNTTSNLLLLKSVYCRNDVHSCMRKPECGYSVVAACEK